MTENALIDTGIPGVRVTRVTAEAADGSRLLYASVEVTGQVKAGSRARQARHRIANFSQRRYERSPSVEQYHFAVALLDAVALRRAYHRLFEKHGHPRHLPTKSDVRQEDVEGARAPYLTLDTVFRVFREDLERKEQEYAAPHG